MNTKKTHLFYCFVAAFALKIFYLPADLSLFNFDSFLLNTTQLTLSVYAIVTSFLLSAVYAVILHKLLKLQNIVFGFCAVLLIVDPFFRYSILTFEYNFLLLVTLLLCLCFAEGKSFRLKSILMAVFVIFSILIDSTAIFCHIPVAALVYGFSLLPTEEKLLNPVGKIKKKQISANKRLVAKKRVTLTAAFAALILLSVFIKTTPLADLLNNIKNDFIPVQIFSYFTDRRLVFVSVPYFFLLAVFITKYLLKKSNGERKNLRFAFDNASFLWFVLPAFAMIFAGIWRYPQSISVCSLMCTITIIFISLYDPETTSEIAHDFSTFYNKHKISVCVSFLAYFFLTQYIFKNIQITILDSILTVAGNRL